MNQQACFFRHEGNLIRLPLDKVLYLEVVKNYVKFFYSGTMHILVRVSMDTALAKLPKGRFLQIHRSFAVAVEEISIIQREYVTLFTPNEQGKDIELPVSKQHYKELKKKITIIDSGG